MVALSVSSQSSVFSASATGAGSTLFSSGVSTCSFSGPGAIGSSSPIDGDIYSPTKVS